MSLAWIHEEAPAWDASKESIIGRAPEGAFDIDGLRRGGLLPGAWWRVEEGGEVVGYAWMDCTWGDAEILLAVGPDHGKRGVGSFILERLDAEAAAQGLNYLFNAVRPTHPRRDAVTRWLMARGFEASGDGLLKRRVRRAET